MKKIIIMTIAAMAVLTASAQFQPGRFSVQPKIGVSINNVAGLENLRSKGVNYASKHMLVGALIGVEFEYQATRVVSLAAGINYSTQGCRWEDFNTTVDKVVNHIENPRLRLGYVNIPFVVNFYVCKGLALKGGVQMGILADAHVNYDYGQSANDHSATVYRSVNVRKDCKKFDFTFPVGISYEFRNHIVLDARYNIGTTRVVNEEFDEGNNGNSQLLLTFGYKFGM